MVKNNVDDLSSLSVEKSMGENQVPFLTSLSLRNFKSIKEAKLELSPLTILVGRNSSGKSTLIQAILLLAQNASSTDPRRLGVKGILDMNESLVTLGQFSELINDAAGQNDQVISIGCSFNFRIPRRGRWYELISKRNENTSSRGIDLWDPSSTIENSKQGYELEFLTNFEESNRAFEKNLLQARGSRAKFCVNGILVQEITATRRESERVIQEIDFDSEFNRSVIAEVKTYGNLKSREGAHAEPRHYLVYPNKLGIRKFEATRFNLGVPITGLESMNTLDILIKHQDDLFSRTSYAANEIIRTLNQISRDSEFQRGEEHSRDTLNARYMAAVDLYARKCFQVARDMPGKEGMLYEETESLWQELIPWERLDIPVKNYLDDAGSGFGYRDRDLDLMLEKGTIEVPESEHDVYLLSELYQGGLPYQFESRELRVLRDGISSSLKEFWVDVKSRVIELKESENVNSIRLVPTGFAMVDDLRDFDSEDDLNLIVGYGVNEFRKYLQQIRYLGPLRKTPTEIYQRFSTPGNLQTPVGLEGERLGQLVFENPSDFYPIPVTKLGAGDIVTEIRECSFKSALESWLFALGIAKSGISSIPESHYGLKVTVDGRPLRSLGVGVSQVIPVIAICLIAGRGSMVLLEEPELHLNPSLQRQLADFFVAMTLPGSDRQLIVETHSEYLITRLRVHSVKSKEKAKLIKLLFASQQETVENKSFSIYQELTPDENGEIPEWPELPGHEDGYFGQVPHDIQQLLQILIERHKNSGTPE